MPEGNYFIDSSSEMEVARLGLQESLYNEIMDLLPTAFSPPGSILDLACGPGGWALQVADTFPASSVVGVDISPEMIAYARAQAEVRELAVQFRIMDMLRFPWDFPDGSFDLVNMRFITGLFPQSLWDTFYHECWRVLRRGGILRYTENVYASTPSSRATHQLAALIFRASCAAGFCPSPYEMTVGALVAQVLQKHGFEAIHLTPYIMDFSQGTPMYRLMRENWAAAIALLKPFVLREKTTSPEAWDQLQEAFAQEWDDPSFCGHSYFSSLVARKG